MCYSKCPGENRDGECVKPGWCKTVECPECDEQQEELDIYKNNGKCIQCGHKREEI